MNVFCLELRNIFVRLHLTDICVYVLVYLVYMWFTYGVYCYMWFTCGVYYIVVVYMWSILYCYLTDMCVYKPAGLHVEYIVAIVTFK